MDSEGPASVGVTPDDLQEAAARMRSSLRGVIPGSIGIGASVQLLAAVLVHTARPSLGGMSFAVAVVVATAALLIPMVVLTTRLGSQGPQRQLAEGLARERSMVQEALRREFETRLTNAMDMADTEARVLDATARALAVTVDGGTAGDEGEVEVLLADNSQAHLKSVLVTGDAGWGCPVASPAACVAARRGQTQVFEDSQVLDACPELQGRPIGRCAAVCVPVSIMGRTVGVVHWAAPLPSRVRETRTSQLEVVAKQLGARVGMLRVMGETRLQASTDALTGLPNRRAFENQVRTLRQDGTPHSVVMADLDHFKLLNDTFGHETGDRALRVYADVLRATLRPHDVVCRYGGEEFAIALPGCTPADAAAACERLRETLALATGGGDGPSFTASYGVAAWDADATLEQLVAKADRALYRAKHQGRNRVTVEGEAADATQGT